MDLRYNIIHEAQARLVYPRLTPTPTPREEFIAEPSERLGPPRRRIVQAYI
jgi:hypothetical protein